MARKHIRQTDKQTPKRQQIFALTAPGASSVLLVGDFTNWQEQPIPLQQEDDGLWQVKVDITPGLHQYRFIVDGEWRDDPACGSRVPNPYGGQDSVRNVI